MKTSAIVLLILTIALSGSSASSTFDRSHGRFPFLAPQHGKGAAQSIRPRYALAKTTGLTWAQTGSIHFYNSSIIENSPIWSFSSRDTNIYNAEGYLVVSKSSSASSGWNLDSLTYLDSSVYVAEVLTESISKSFGNYNDTSYSSGYRETYQRLNGNTVSLVTSYDWNDTKKAWVPTYKDSVLSSSPFGNGSWYSDYSIINGYYYSIFDTISKTWKLNEYEIKIPGECNATTLVYGGKTAVNDTSSTLVDGKMIFTFSATPLTSDNMTQIEMQRKDSIAGIYFDYSKYIYGYSDKGYETTWGYYNWDSTTMKLVLVEKFMDFPDSHGNDTLAFDIFFDSSTNSLDTGYLNHYTRTYDANGNNTTTIESYKDFSTSTWTITGKSINSFAQINSAIRVPPQTTAKQGISILSTAARLVVNAPNITGLVIFNIAGRIVATVNQEAAKSISLDLGKTGVLSGVYVARLVYDNEQTSFRFSVQR